MKKTRIVLHACAGRYEHSGFVTRRALNVTYKILWGFDVHQTLRTIRLAFMHACAERYVQSGFVTMCAPYDVYRIAWHSCIMRTCAKYYVQKGLASMHAPNVTYKMVWHQFVRQTVLTKPFAMHACARRYIQSGLASIHAPDVTYKMVWLPCVRQTLCTKPFRDHVSSISQVLRTKWFGIRTCAKRYVQRGFVTMCVPDVTCKTVNIHACARRCVLLTLPSLMYCCLLTFVFLYIVYGA